MNPTFLRPDTDVIDDWEKDVAALRTELSTAEEHAQRASASGRLGQLLALDAASRPEAIRLLEEAVALARQCAASLVAPNLIRLATALQYAGRHQEAVDLFEAALVCDTADAEKYRHFAHQHYGKCLAEMGRFERARRQFDAALEDRRRLGDARLLASTKEAVAELDTRSS